MTRNTFLEVPTHAPAQALMLYLSIVQKMEVCWCFQRDIRPCRVPLEVGEKMGDGSCSCRYFFLTSGKYSMYYDISGEVLSYLTMFGQVYV